MSETVRSRHGGAVFVKGCIKAAMAALFVILFYLWIHGFTVTDQADYVAWHLSLPYRCAAVFLAAVFAFSLFALIRRALGLLRGRQLHILTVVLLAGMVSLQCFFLFYFRSMYLWDEAFVVGGATSLVQTGRIAQDAYYYLSIYPNQHPFVIVTAALLRLGSFLSLDKAGQYLLLNIAGTLCLDTAILFLLVIQSELLSGLDPDRRARRRCYLLFLLAFNPFIYVFAAYYYTIALSLPFLVGGICFGLKAFGKKPIFSIVAGLLFGVGYALRPTTIIPVIACLVTGAFLAMTGKGVKHLLHACMIAALALLVGCLLSLGAHRLVGIDTTDTAFPTTHWLMMSLTSPGNHNEEDEAFTACFATKEEKRQAVGERLVSKLQDLGIGGYLHLVKDKVDYTWESGNHAYAFYTGNTLRTRGIFKWIYGSHRDAVALFGQGCYLFLIGCMLLTLLQQFFLRQKDGAWDEWPGIFLLFLTILGCILFYILWETGTQYSLVVFPLFFLTASLCGEHAPKKEGKAGVSAALTPRRRLGIELALGVFAFSAFCIFCGKVRPVFTDQSYERDDVAVLQLLANEPWELRDGNVLTQELVTDRPVNKMIFQYRNFVTDGSNDSVYLVRLIGNEPVWEESIVAEKQPQNGAFIKSFEEIPPGSYKLEIRKTAGSEEKNLSFVAYRMGGYDAYTNGRLLLGKEPQDMDLMIGLYQTAGGTYTTARKYVVFRLVGFAYFLFWEICCILLYKCDIKGKSGDK